MAASRLQLVSTDRSTFQYKGENPLRVRVRAHPFYGAFRGRSFDFRPFATTAEIMQSLGRLSAFVSVIVSKTAAVQQLLTESDEICVSLVYRTKQRH